MRLTEFALSAVVLLCAGPAQAKKSQSEVHNCTDTNVEINGYSGDDGTKDSPRESKKVKSGERQQFNCKVDSGKKRCFFKVTAKTWEESSAKHVKDERTVFITKVSQYAETEPGMWGQPDKITRYTRVDTNAEGCDPASVPTKTSTPAP